MSEFIDKLREQKLKIESVMLYNENHKINILELYSKQELRRENLLKVAGEIALRATTLGIKPTKFNIIESTNTPAPLNKNRKPVFRKKEYQSPMYAYRNVENFFGWNLSSKSVSDTNLNYQETYDTWTDGNILSEDGTLIFYSTRSGYSSENNETNLYYEKYDNSKMFESSKNLYPINRNNFMFSIDDVEHDLINFVLKNEISIEGL